MTALAAIDSPAPVLFEEIDREDLPKLIALALVLDRARRRARFGASLTDQAVRRHYFGLNLARFLAYGAFVQRRLEAVVEIHALGDDWRRAEICALGLPNAQTRWGAALAKAAAARAQTHGCSDLVWIEVGEPDGWTRAISAGLGEIKLHCVR
jgi:hypothetical protein